MKLPLITFLLLSASSAAFASSFRADSPVPAQLQGQVLEALAAQCEAGADWTERKTSVAEAAGETYFESTFTREGNAKPATVISGIGRLGGFGVINVDCGA